MSIDLANLGELRERVIRFRAAHFLTQGEFAQLCGLTRPTIGALEAGGYRPGQKAIAEISWAKIVNYLDNYEKQHGQD